MGQAIHNIADDEGGCVSEPTNSRLSRVLPALLGALVCTGLIVEAIITVAHGRENGDLMVIVCPILGATFISIPAARAWWTVFQNLKKPS
jgi:hypothetical protein